MRRLTLIFIGFLLVSTPFSKAEEKQVKMNPDGYINGTTFSFEAGYDFGLGSYETKLDEIYWPETISQDRKISNPFLKFSILIPKSETTTLVLNVLASAFKEKGLENQYFNEDKLSYARFSVSLGFKLYFKRIY